MVEYDTFITSQLASSHQLCGLVWCKSVHVTPQKSGVNKTLVLHRVERWLRLNNFNMKLTSLHSLLLLEFGNSSNFYLWSVQARQKRLQWQSSVRLLTDLRCFWDKTCPVSHRPGPKPARCSQQPWASPASGWVWGCCSRAITPEQFSRILPQYCMDRIFRLHTPYQNLVLLCTVASKAVSNACFSIESTEGGNLIRTSVHDE